MHTKGTEKTKRTKTRAEKIFSVATSVLLVVAVLFCGFVMIQLMSNGYVTVFGYSAFHVVSGSMEPTIPVGTLIICQKTPIEYIGKGDIITFKSLETYMAGKMVTHRVVEVETFDGKIALRTRGDNNNSEDGYYVTQDNLIGLVVHQTSGKNILKSLYDTLTTKNGFFAIVVLPVLILTTIIMRGSVKRINREIANIKREVARLSEANKSDESDDGTDEDEPPTREEIDDIECSDNASEHQPRQKEDQK